MEAHLLRVEFERPLFLHQAPDNQHHRQALGDDRRQRDTRDVQMADDDEKEVEDDVQDAGGRQVVERPLGVPHRPEDRRTEVVDQHERAADKDDPHVGGGFADDIFRRRHQLQQRVGDRQPHYDQQQPAHNGNQHRGLDRLPDVILLPGPVVPGD